MINPYLMSWVNPTANTDGSTLAQTDIAGYEIAIDGAPAISVPIGYATSYDLTQLSVFPTLKSGSHTASLAVTNKEGLTGVAASVSFPVLPIPGTVTALVVGK